ncbi:MAG: hypothetical protein QM766_03055 [Burkholderiaceae bacterium]
MRLSERPNRSVTRVSAPMDTDRPPSAGALLIVNNIDEGSDDELNHWYQNEHLPNRLNIDGFQRARRYQAIDGQPAYIAFYECDSVDVLKSRAYLDRVLNPTPWTRRVLPKFRNVVRAACRTTVSVGSGIGGSAIVVFCTPMSGRHDAARRFLETTLAPKLKENGALVRLILLETDSAVTGMPNEERLLRNDQDNYPHWVLLIETYNLDKAALLFHAQILDYEAAQVGLLFGSWARYRLILAVSRRDLDLPDGPSSASA